MVSKSNPKNSKASPKTATTIDPMPVIAAVTSEPAAGVVENDDLATSSAPGGAGEAYSSEVSTASSAADGLTAGAAQGADSMPAVPETAAGTDTAPADDLDVQHLYFDLTRVPTADERNAFKVLLVHMKRHGVFPDLVTVGFEGGSSEDRKVLLDALSMMGVEPMPLTGYTGTSLALADVSFAEHSEREIPSSLAIPVLQAASEEGGPWRLRIRSKIEGFRRAGTTHSKEACEHDLSDFTTEQVAVLLAEPNLTVEIF